MNVVFSEGVTAKALLIVFGVNTLSVGLKGKEPMFQGIPDE